jgi:hypothetical protein
VQFVTIDGEVVDTDDEASVPARLRKGILALCDDVLSDPHATQRLRARQEMKLTCGCNLITFVRLQQITDWIGQLLVGSVGTSRVVTRATLRANLYVEGRATTLLALRILYVAVDEG